MLFLLWVLPDLIAALIMILGMWLGGEACGIDGRC